MLPAPTPVCVSQLVRHSCLPPSSTHPSQPRRPNHVHAKEGEGGGVCGPRVFCASKIPSFLARWRARGPAGTGSVGDSVGEGAACKKAWHDGKRRQQQARGGGQWRGEEGNRRPGRRLSWCPPWTCSAARHRTPAACSPHWHWAGYHPPWRSGCPPLVVLGRSRCPPLPPAPLRLRRGSERGKWGGHGGATTRPTTRPKDRWHGSAEPHSPCHRHARQADGREASTAGAMRRQPPAVCRLPPPASVRARPGGCGARGDAGWVALLTGVALLTVLARAALLCSLPLLCLHPKLRCFADCRCFVTAFRPPAPTASQSACLPGCALAYTIAY